MISELATSIAGSLPAQFPAQTFQGPEINWFALSPMLALLAGALGIMVVGALTPQWPKGMYALVSAMTAVTAGAFAMVQWDDITDNGVQTLVGGAIAFDTFAMFLSITICISLLLVSLFTDSFLRGTPNDGPEIYALYMDPYFQGMGLGRALLLDVTKHLVMAGFDALGGITLVGNHHASRFYEELGGTSGEEIPSVVAGSPADQVAYVRPEIDALAQALETVDG